MPLPLFCPSCGKETRGAHVGQQWGPDVAAEIEAEIGEPVSVTPVEGVAPPGDIRTASGRSIETSHWYCEDCAAEWRQQIAAYRQRIHGELATPPMPEPPTPPMPPEPPAPPAPEPPEPPRRRRMKRGQP